MNQNTKHIHKGGPPLICCHQNVRATSRENTIKGHAMSKKSTPVVTWLSYSPLDPMFAGSDSAGDVEFFQSVKILSMSSFGREGKPWVPCRSFTARKRTSNQN